jgi:multidrug transporter EmrE-like cation transporter
MPGILAIFVAQCFYTVADVFQKKVLGGAGFSARTLLSIPFLATLLVSGTGFVFQMFALSKVELSRTIILLGVFGVVLAAIAGVLVFHDKLSVKNYVGIGLAVLAIILVRAK